MNRGLFMLNTLQKFLLEEDGVTAIEYGLIAALIAIVIASAVTLAGTNLKALFTTIAACIAAPATAACP
jgi:pilus assembly protein Flp/PilA